MCQFLHRPPKQHTFCTEICDTYDAVTKAHFRGLVSVLDEARLYAWYVAKFLSKKMAMVK